MKKLKILKLSRDFRYLQKLSLNTLYNWLQANLISCSHIQNSALGIKNIPLTFLLVTRQDRNLVNQNFSLRNVLAD